MPLPEVTFQYDIYSFTLINLLLGFDVDLDGTYPSGSFGANSFANVTLTNDVGGNLGGLNTVLTMLDNQSAADSPVGDGVLEGWVSASITVTAVPEPATIVLLAIGGVAFWRSRR